MHRPRDSGARCYGRDYHRGVLRLTGRVVDETHQPVPGPHVLLEPLRRSAKSDRQLVTSLADGTFTFEHLAEQRYAVSATKDDFYAWHVIIAMLDGNIARTPPGETTPVIDAQRA